MTDEARANADGHLQRFERKVRRLEVGVAVLVGIVAVLLGALVLERIRVPANISARAFSLVDESGKVVASLARSPGGGVLVLESRAGAEKIVLGMINDTAGLAVVGRDMVRASLLVGEGGASPSLTIRDREGRARIMAGLDRVDLPSVSLWNKDAHLDFLVRPGYSPILQVFADDGSSLFSVSPRKDRHSDGDEEPTLGPRPSGKDKTEN